jgi:ribonuclease BN (tRNA processing enzyme)
MEIIFLGTNGWYDTNIANTLSVLIKTRKYDIVLDAGNGIYKLDKYTDGTKPVYLFLSHFHLDHVAGLHTLLKFDFKKGLTICGGKGARKYLGALLRRPFTVPLNKLRYRSKVIELPAGLKTLPFKCSCLPLVHADPVLGYRLELDGRVVAFCTDTGYCENAVKLAAKADLLISECAYLSGERNPGWPHMNPETAAALARAAGVGKLALVHFDAARYPDLKARAGAGKAARKIFKAAFASSDGLKLKI